MTLGRQEEERAHTCASVACAKQDFLVLQLLPPLIGKAARENSLSLSPLPSFSVSLPPAPPSRISVLSSGISHGPTPSLPSSLSNATRVGLTIIHPNRNDLKPQTDNRSAGNNAFFQSNNAALSSFSKLLALVLTKVQKQFTPPPLTAKLIHITNLLTLPNY